MYVISDSWANCSQVKMLMKIEDCSCRKWAITVAFNFANVVIPHPCWSMAVIRLVFHLQWPVKCLNMLRQKSKALWEMTIYLYLIFLPRYCSTTFTAWKCSFRSFFPLLVDMDGLRFKPLVHSRDLGQISVWSILNYFGCFTEHSDADLEFCSLKHRCKEHVHLSVHQSIYLLTCKIFKPQHFLFFILHFQTRICCLSCAMLFHLS